MIIRQFHIQNVNVKLKMSLLRNILITSDVKRFSGLRNKVTLFSNGKIKCNNHVRDYRNISHGPPPVARFSKYYYCFIIFTLLGCLIDFKTLLGLRDKEKELESLLNYTIPDEIVTYSEKPGLKDKN